MSIYICGYCDDAFENENYDPVTCEANLCTLRFCSLDCADSHMGKHEDNGDVERNRDGNVIND